MTSLATPDAQSNSYRLTTDHPQSSYSQPVLLDQHGHPHSPVDAGLAQALPPNFCGRVDVLQVDGERWPGVKVYWTGYGPNRRTMSGALFLAARENPEHVEVTISSPTSATLTRQGGA